MRRHQIATSLPARRLFDEILPSSNAAAAANFSTNKAKPYHRMVDQLRRGGGLWKRTRHAFRVRPGVRCCVLMRETHFYWGHFHLGFRARPPRGGWLRFTRFDPRSSNQRDGVAECVRFRLAAMPLRFFFCLAKLFDGLGEIYSLLGRFADYHSFFLYKDPKIDLRIY